MRQLRPQSLRRRLVINLAVDAGLPWLAVQYLDRIWHLPTVQAFAIAALFPLASILYNWVRDRRADVIGMAVLATIVGGIAVALSTDDVRYALVKAAPGFGLFGLACLASLATDVPLMFYVIRQFNTAGQAERSAPFTARLEQPSFRRSMRRITIVWGIVALAEAAAGIAAAFLLRPDLALIVEPTLGLGTVALLLAWTFRFARRSAPART
jgi:hypothetical protein